jgi:hypothetical protein
MLRKRVAGSWIRLHSEELYNVYALPDIIIRMIKLRRMRWAWHVARNGNMINAHNILFGKPEGRDYSKDLGVDGNRMDLSEIGWQVVD